MMNLQPSQLFRYLTDGHDERLILTLLRDQPGASKMLAGLRADLERLGPEALDPAVRRRLELATEAVSGLSTPENVLPRLQRQTIDTQIADAIRAGARQTVALGFLLLDRSSSQPIRSTKSPTPAPRPRRFMAPGKDVAALYAREIDEDPYEADLIRQELADWGLFRVPVPGGGALLLRLEVQNATDYLSVQLEGKHFAPGPILVTWLPDEGDVCRVFTDGSGEATLPWPAIGHGILRIDAARTIECELLVRL